MHPMEALDKKAQLVTQGSIFISKFLRLPHRPSISTAGPGAGVQAYIFEFGDTRVRLYSAPEDQTPFSLVYDSGEYRILREGKPFVDGVKLVPVLMHTAGQAFINLDSRCRYDCAFCDTPGIEGRRKPVDEIIQRLEGIDPAELHAIALTTGVADSEGKANEYVAEVASAIKKRFPDKPVGVEVYASSERELDMLKKAGVEELKINVEASSPELFAKVCPGLDYQKTWWMLQHGVQLFGWNRVCSNLIVGLGEDENEALCCVDNLAKMGVVANIRPLRITPANRDRLLKALGWAPDKVNKDKLIRLAAEERRILRKYKLDPLLFKTMCLRCGCCDLVPNADI